MASSDISQNTVNHLAIIMDGNYRWAQGRSKSVTAGHKMGAQNIKNVVEAAIERDIKYVTLYAFSSENWNRPRKEVDYLMGLLEDYLGRDIKEIAQKNVKIVVSGNFDKLKDKVKEKIVAITQQTADNDLLTLNIAFSYGSRQEITDAFKKLLLAVNKREINIEELGYQDIVNNLYQPDMPDPDLLVRTGGDNRISNFLLLQIAYTELYFTEVLWPDFSSKDLDLALEDFNKRIRRYGKR